VKEIIRPEGASAIEIPVKIAHAMQDMIALRKNPVCKTLPQEWNDMIPDYLLHASTHGSYFCVKFYGQEREGF
jgi:hypothetical protein